MEGQCRECLRCGRLYSERPALECLVDNFMIGS